MDYEGFKPSVSHPVVLMRERLQSNAPLEPIKKIQFNVMDNAFVGDVINVPTDGAQS